MTRIALCDNEPSGLEELHRLLKHEGARRGQEMETARFDSPWSRWRRWRGSRRTRNEILT